MKIETLKSAVFYLIIDINIQIFNGKVNTQGGYMGVNLCACTRV